MHHSPPPVMLHVTTRPTSSMVLVYICAAAVLADYHQH